jgi:hypothetical protein
MGMPPQPPCDRCPQCGEPVQLSGPLRLISLHRDSHGRHCESSGRSLVHHRYRELLQTIYGGRR